MAHRQLATGVPGEDTREANEWIVAGNGVPGGSYPPGQARTGTPFSSSTCFNSPVSNISRTMSQPPMNSPLT